MSKKEKPVTLNEKENAVTFDDFDQLNLRSFAENLFDIMEKGTDSSIEDLGEKGSYTISLNAEFGNGKTAFLKMFEHFIRTEKENSYDVLFIDAWRSDFYGEPVIAILSELVNSYSNEHKNQDENQKKNPTILEIKKLIGTLTKIKSLKDIGNQIIKDKIGVDINEIVDNQKLGENVLKEFDQRKEAIKKITKLISSNTEEKKLLIIVDELDRARPDYAVHFLEDMKHFFDIETVVFLVAVNRVQMEATVKCLYGQGLNFDGYYNKFFKQEKDLPDPYKEAQRLIDILIKKTKIKYPQDISHPEENREFRVENAYLCCKMFKLTLREIEQFIRLYEMILADEPRFVDCVYTVDWEAYKDVYSFFICLSMKKKDVFQKILKDQFTLDNFIQLVNNSDIDYNYDRENRYSKRALPYKYNLLFGTVACFFIEREFLIKQREKIERTFRSVEGNTIDNIISVIPPSITPPAIKICKEITKCKATAKGNR